MRWFMSMRSVPFEFASQLATQFGAVECAWRESERSFTGFVAVVWFDQLPDKFSCRWSAVVGYQVVVRCVSAEPGRFALRGGQRGEQVRVRLVV